MLFLVAGPASIASPEAKQALRKLVHALPETFRAEAEAAATATVFDPAGWGTISSVDVPEHLDTLRRVVVEHRQVRLGYVDREGNETTRVVHPLGVAKKGASWYLVAGTERGQRTFRIGRVRQVDVLDEPVERPSGFDLVALWRRIVDEVEAKRHNTTARLRVPRAVVGWLHGTFGPSVDVHEEPASGGRGADTVEVVVGGHSAESIARQLAGWGRRDRRDRPARTPPGARVVGGRAAPSSPGRRAWRCHPATVKSVLAVDEVKSSIRTRTVSVHVPIEGTAP